jgi:probable phosphoglycerate mutase
LKEGRFKKKIIICLIILAMVFGFGSWYRAENYSTTIYLVRHGQTEANVKGILMGSGGDSPLTADGEKAVEATGKYLAPIRFRSAYSSPMGRAVKTRDIIISENKYKDETPKKKLGSLRDLSWGKVEGMTIEDASKKFKNLSDETVFGNIDDSSFKSKIGAESLYHYYRRFDRCLGKIAEEKENRDGNVLVVTHSAAGRYLAKKIGNKDYSNIDNASVTVIRYRHSPLGKTGWEMVSFNKKS